MARPAGVPTRQLEARVPCDLFEAAVRLGEKQGLDISSTIIQALQEWVDAQEEDGWILYADGRRNGPGYLSSEEMG